MNQPKETPSIYYVLLSRKFWMAFIGLVLILVTAWNQDPYPTDAVVTAIMGVVAAFIGATAWEDSSRNQAAGNIAAADIKASTTTVTTPGESDVTVTAPPTVQPSGTGTVLPPYGTYRGGHP